MKILIILITLFMSFCVFSKGINVDFSCPETTSVNISLDEKGRVIFTPDVFSEGPTEASGNISECVQSFQDRARKELADFKQKSCPASKDTLCFASIRYTQSKVAEKINKSQFINSSPDTVPAVTINISNVHTALEEKVVSGEVDLKNLKQTFNHGGKKYKVSEFDSVIGENIENIFMNMTRDEANQYAQNYLVAKSSILKDASNPGRALVMGNLEKMYGYIHGENAQSELSKDIDACSPINQVIAPIQGILEKIDITRKVLTCRPVNPGEHKVFKKEMKNYYSTGNYLLKRRKDGNYQAILNVNFVQGAGSVSPQQMLQRAKGCLADASPFMKGPGGEQMEIVALSPEEIAALPKDERPAPNKISIEGPGHTNNAAAYSEKIDCATITHEMLHLFGLCDEYGETRPEYMKHGWSCRVITKSPSIMRDLRAYQNTIGGTLSCNCSGTACSGIMKSNDSFAKKLYTTNSFYDLTDHRYRTTYCREEFIPANKLSNPSKITNVIQNEGNTMVVEGRYLYTTLAAPYYSISNMKITCRCPAGDSSCIETKNSLASVFNRETPRKTCPREAPHIASEAGQKTNGAHFDGSVLKIASPGSENSLLQPNHFHKILEGNCPGKADGYRKCADFAYKGEPCNVPSQCHDDRYYLGSEK